MSSSLDTISYTLPRLPYTAYDRAMNVPLHTLSHILEGVQMSYGVDSELNQFEQFRLGGSNLTIVCCRHRLGQGFYAGLGLGEGATQMDLTGRAIRFENRLLYVGSSSFDVLTEMVLAEDSSPLGSSVFKYVRVDHEGRVLKTPQAFVERHRGLSAETGSIKVEELRLGSVVHTHEVTVAFSDLDSNYHVNHKGYLKYAIDCLSELSYHDRLNYVRGDIAAARFDEVESLYLKDAKGGERLTVKASESRQDVGGVARTQLVCLIENEGGEVINQTSITLAPKLAP